jgi:lipoate-protein ligase A
MYSASLRNFSVPVFPDPPRKNDALFLYGALCSHPFVFVYTQKTIEVVYGPACKPENEIHLQECTRDNIAVLKRRSGGGTVVLSPGMVIIIVVGNPLTRLGPLEIFSNIHDAIIGVLGSYGATGIHKLGISDLAINENKILGSSLYLKHSPNLYFYQSALMVDSDLSLLGKYLAYPPREPEYRQKRSHEDFCTTLKKEGFAIPADKIAEAMQRKLPGKLEF